eukprot:8381368-Pyramimonas_sp.AAC.1
MTPSTCLRCSFFPSDARVDFHLVELLRWAIRNVAHVGVDNRGEPTIVVEVIKALLELALHEVAFGEDLLGVEVPLSPGVARP